ncbi:hypothetical protein VB834_16960 [Limnoraphis robusta Tam1]|nr:hypothetical protein [Limnoraphis robusta]MEA5540711.1 hypothetical protein [Limnoraphis robusta Tam1]
MILSHSWLLITFVAEAKCLESLSAIGKPERKELLQLISTDFSVR